eukprot:scaffold35899_cov66-Phaeocystis_antarctica.AAC.4
MAVSYRNPIRGRACRVRVGVRARVKVRFEVGVIESGSVVRVRAKECGAHVGRELCAGEESGRLLLGVARRLLDLEDDLTGLGLALVAAHPCAAGLHETHRLVGDWRGWPVAKAMDAGIDLPSHRREGVLEAGARQRRQPEI